MSIITEAAVNTRNNWIAKIQNLTGDFATNSLQVERDLGTEIATLGVDTLIDHIRLCGNIPEIYAHDTSEEKQYSKYTDSLLCYAYRQMGFRSLVITGRANVADVEAFTTNYDFVADAKAFRLSRTAKNQKDFKVEAMDGWKHGKPYAMVVCPIYQLPSRRSQIYQQAITRSVCVFTYSHLSLLVRYAEATRQEQVEDLLHQVFDVIPALNPSQVAVDYWLAVNRTILRHSPTIAQLWRDEKLAATESIQIAKQEALAALAAQRATIMGMSHQDALTALIQKSKIDTKIDTINKVADNGLFAIQ